MVWDYSPQTKIVFVESGQNLGANVDNCTCLPAYDYVGFCLHEGVRYFLSQQFLAPLTHGKSERRHLENTAFVSVEKRAHHMLPEKD